MNLFPRRSYFLLAISIFKLNQSYRFYRIFLYNMTLTVTLLSADAGIYGTETVSRFGAHLAAMSTRRNATHGTAGHVTGPSQVITDARKGCMVSGRQHFHGRGQ